MNIKAKKIVEDGLINKLQRIVANVPLGIPQAVAIGTLISKIQTYCRGCLPVIKEQKIVYDRENMTEEYNKKYQQFLQTNVTFEQEVINITGYTDFNDSVFDGIINFTED